MKHGWNFIKSQVKDLRQRSEPPTVNVDQVIKRIIDYFISGDFSSRLFSSSDVFSTERFLNDLPLLKLYWMLNLTYRVPCVSSARVLMVKLGMFEKYDALLLKILLMPNEADIRSLNICFLTTA
jgi:hypothetical protein